jgi:hypothetical protein
MYIVLSVGGGRFLVIGNGISKGDLLITLILLISFVSLGGKVFHVTYATSFYEQGKYRFISLFQNKFPAKIGQLISPKLLIAIKKVSFTDPRQPCSVSLAK